MLLALIELQSLKRGNLVTCFNFQYAKTKHTIPVNGNKTKVRLLCNKLTFQRNKGVCFAISSFGLTRKIDDIVSCRQNIQFGRQMKFGNLGRLDNLKQVHE